MVKKGYKQTEIGIIPEDWDVNSLKSIVVGNLKYGINAAAIPYNSNLPQYLRITDITEDGRFSKKDRTSVKVSNLDSYWLHSNDIVFARTGASTGKTYLYREKDGDMVYAGFLIKANIDTLKADPVFIFYQFHTNRYWNWVATISQRSGQPGINSKEYSSFDIILPKLEEQKAIATALSDVDNLIDNLEKLIEKKKKIKQGTMQELLTGKKRLPGFVESWNTINLSKNSKIKARIGWQGLTTAEYQQNGYSLLVTGTDFKDGKILWSNCHYVSKERFNQDTNIQIKNNDILITKDGTIGKVAIVERLEKPATLNSGVFVVRPNNKSYYPQFLYYILLSFVFRDFLDKLSAGSTIVHLYQKDLVGFEFEAPPTIEEQTAIANLLSDMDEEITALNKKLNKTKALKQGMMQKLLTGEIRLV